MRPLLVDVEVGLAARALHVKGAAGGELDGLFGGGVVDEAFADEFHLAVGVAAIEADAAGGQGHAKMIGFAVLDLLDQRDLVVAVVEAIATLLVDVAIVIGRLELGGRRRRGSSRWTVTSAASMNWTCLVSPSRRETVRLRS